MPETSQERTTPMQVLSLSLGMCRTGTESMRQALSQLGYGYIYHANATMERPHDHRLWEGRPRATQNRSQQTLYNMGGLRPHPRRLRRRKGLPLRHVLVRANGRVP